MNEINYSNLSHFEVNLLRNILRNFRTQKAFRKPFFGGFLLLNPAKQNGSPVLMERFPSEGRPITFASRISCLLCLLSLLFWGKVRSSLFAAPYRLTASKSRFEVCPERPHSGRRAAPEDVPTMGIPARSVSPRGGTAAAALLDRKRTDTTAASALRSLVVPFDLLTPRGHER